MPGRNGGVHWSRLVMLLELRVPYRNCIADEEKRKVAGEVCRGVVRADSMRFAILVNVIGIYQCSSEA